MKSALLIPIYEPCNRVLPFLLTFSKEEFDIAIVVNDGSNQKFDAVFEEIAKTTVFDVVSYPKNRGKGHALKVGMAEILKRCPDVDFIVTADGDGQHTHKDVLAIRDACVEHPNELVLGVRDFSSMPSKSQNGNKWASRYFYLSTQQKLSDTQTGLRGIPSALFGLSLDTYGERYEYEMNFLLTAAKQFKTVQIPIETIYFDNNKESHFRPFWDSLRIARNPIVYVGIGLTSYVVDILIYSLLISFLFTDAVTSSLSNFYAAGIARVLSATYNYLMLEKVAFHHKKGYGHSFWKYVVLWVTSLGVSYGLSELFKLLWPSLIALKVIIDGVSGVIKYFLNRYLVFFNKVKKD